MAHHSATNTAKKRSAPAPQQVLKKVWSTFSKKKEEKGGEEKIKKIIAIPKEKEEKSKKMQRAGDYAHVLIKPHITEKSTYANSLNKYVFEIPSSASKVQVATALKALYNIKPLKINIINRKGKYVEFRRIPGRRKDRKLAIITIPKNKKLNIYEGT